MVKVLCVSLNTPQACVNACHTSYNHPQMAVKTNKMGGKYKTNESHRNNYPVHPYSDWKCSQLYDIQYQWWNIC